MRKRGLKKAVLLIELEPCAVCGGYDKGHPDVDTKVPGVSSQLPKDAQLIVVDGDSATYFSHAPTDPQKRSRAPAQKIRGGGRNRAPDPPRTLAGRGRSRQSQKGSLRAGKVEDIAGQRRGGGGGGEPAAVAESSTAAESVVPPGSRVTEGFGDPVAPITVPEPATAMLEARGAQEGAAAMINSGLLNALRTAELQKAIDRLTELGPEIEEYRRKGYDVTVTLVAELPYAYNLATDVTGVGDIGDVVRYRKMYISQVVKHRDTPQTATSVSENLAPGDPEAVDPQDLSLQQQIEVQMGEQHPVAATRPRKGYYFGSRDLFLPAYQQPASKASDESAPDPNQLQGIAGNYEPKLQQLFSGSQGIIPRLLNRRLSVEQHEGGELLPRMYAGSQEYSYQGFRARGKSFGDPIVMNSVFTIKADASSDAVGLDSVMTYPREGLILEWVKDWDPQRTKYWETKFDALISWHKV